jgi:hypothetical protein
VTTNKEEKNDRFFLIESSSASVDDKRDGSFITSETSNGERYSLANDYLILYGTGDIIMTTEALKVGEKTVQLQGAESLW